ncbi:hypothetical protein TeGR_g1556, partial [Tetraparma gracilis]
MAVTGEVEFQLPHELPKSGEFRSSLTVSCAGTSIEVPIVARLPAPRIEFDGYCNLGFVPPGVVVSKQVTITNAGTREGGFEIVVPENVRNLIKITPSVGTLAAGFRHVDLDGDGRMEGGDELVATKDGSNATTVTIDFEGADLGPFRALAVVLVPGYQDQILDVSAQVVASTLELVRENGGGALGETLDFGPKLYGQ